VLRKTIGWKWSICRGACQTLGDHAAGYRKVTKEFRYVASRDGFAPEEAAAQTASNAAAITSTAHAASSRRR
jgi:hypothetical protein